MNDGMSMSVDDNLEPTAGSRSSPQSTVRRKTVLYVVAALFALFGLADAIYLTIEHVTGQSVRCTLVAGCSEVLSSSYAAIAGIPLAAVGAAAYFCVFSLATLAAFRYRIAGLLLTLLVTTMFAVSLWLVYLQAFVIRAFCQYCLFSAGITLLLVVLVFAARVFRDASQS